MTNQEDINHSRRAIDSILVARFERFESKFDAFVDCYNKEMRLFEARLTKLETFATVRGMLGGALTALLTAIAGAVVWLWRS